MRTRTTPLLFALAALALGSAAVPRADAAEALPNSKHVVLLAPADGATIEYTSPDEVVTFSFRVDDSAILAEAAQAGDSDASGRCEVQVGFYLDCAGPACKSRPANHLDRTHQEPVAVRVGALLELTSGDPSQRHAFIWGADLRYIQNNSMHPPCTSTELVATAVRFSLVKRMPPDLSLSVERDAAGVWPKTVTVTNKGGASKPTFLIVTVKTLSPTDPPVAKYCAVMDETKTHTVLEMAPGAKRTFDVPDLRPSQAQHDALLHALATPTPPPPKTTPKAGVAQAPTFKDPNLHQYVGCQYALTAKLGADTNAKDPDKKDNTLSRTIRIDVPMN